MFDLLEWLTGPRPLITPEEEGWQFSCFEWLMRGTGGFGRFRHAVVVLPTDTFFPQKGQRSPALQEALFAQIKAHAGMGEWACTLAMQEADPSMYLTPRISVQGSLGTEAGTFRRSGSQALISYNPSLLADPMAFVATMAHELAHFVVSEIAEEPPGGAENLEFATDMAAIFLGFGVFLVNSSFRFWQSGNSIASRRLGYLSEEQRIFALAMFTQLLGQDPAPISRGIHSQFRRMYRRGLRDVEKSERIQDLRLITPVDASSRDIPAPLGIANGF
jgi:hypothetical protein